MAEAPVIALSDKSGLRVVCRNEEPAVYAQGGKLIHPKRRALTAQFMVGGAPSWAYEEAFKKFEFRGKTDDVPVELMIGVFDSAWAQAQYGWTDEEHDAVVRHLRSRPSQYWFVAERPKVSAPFPSLDKLKPHGRRTAQISAEQIVQAATLGGHSLEDVLIYLRQEEWDSRVIEAVQAALLEQSKVEEEAEELVEA